MRRLSPRRDHVLRQAGQGRVAWRSDTKGMDYAWCRDCGKDVTKQVCWLLDNDYVQIKILMSKDEQIRHLGIGPSANYAPYVAKYPR